MRANNIRMTKESGEYIMSMRRKIGNGNMSTLSSTTSYDSYRATPEFGKFLKMRVFGASHAVKYSAKHVFGYADLHAVA